MRNSFRSPIERLRSIGFSRQNELIRFIGSLSSLARVIRLSEVRVEAKLEETETAHLLLFTYELAEFGPWFGWTLDIHRSGGSSESLRRVVYTSTSTYVPISKITYNEVSDTRYDMDDA